MCCFWFCEQFYVYHLLLVFVQCTYCTRIRSSFLFREMHCSKILTPRTVGDLEVGLSTKGIIVHTSFPATDADHSYEYSVQYVQRAAFQGHLNNLQYSKHNNVLGLANPMGPNGMSSSKKKAACYRKNGVLLGMLLYSSLILCMDIGQSHKCFLPRGW